MEYLRSPYALGKLRQFRMRFYLFCYFYLLRALGAATRGARRPNPWLGLYTLPFPPRVPSCASDPFTGIFLPSSGIAYRFVPPCVMAVFLFPSAHRACPEDGTVTLPQVSTCGDVHTMLRVHGCSP